MMFKEDTIRRLPGRRVGLVLLAMALTSSLLLTPAAKPAQAAFPGQNGKIAFTRTEPDGSSEIYTMDPDGNNQTNLSNDPKNDSQPVVSPDGKKLAFTSDRGGDDEIYLMDTDPSTDDATNLSKFSSAGDSTPVFSPDGNKIAFTSVRTDHFEVFVMNAKDGSGQKNLTNHLGRDIDPDRAVAS
jgi:Tol biopolymer transport system component